MPQFTVQLSGYTVSEILLKLMPMSSRKHFFSNMGWLWVNSLFNPWYMLAMCHEWNIPCMCLLLKHRLVFPHSFWRGVLAGRSEPNSVPLLLLFQGGRRCEPLKQQEETAGGRSDSRTYRQTDTNRHVVLLAGLQMLCSSVQKPGSCKKQI